MNMVYYCVYGLAWSSSTPPRQFHQVRLLSAELPQQMPAALTQSRSLSRHTITLHRGYEMMIARHKA